METVKKLFHAQAEKINVEKQLVPSEKCSIDAFSYTVKHESHHGIFF